MAIVTEDDKLIYFPSVTLSGDALTGAIALIQTLVESPIGANRSLELTAQVEIKPINVNFQTAQFSLLPIATSPTPSIQVRRGEVLTGYRRSLGITDWQTLSASDYTIDPVGGRVHFDIKTIDGWGRFGYRNTQAKLSYTSGFDFADDSYEVRSIKSLFGQMLLYSQTIGYQSGITEVDIDGEYRVRYGATSGGGNATAGAGILPETFLIPFRKYRPRHWQ